MWGYGIASRIAYKEAASGCNNPGEDPRTWEQLHRYTATFVGRTQLGVGLNFGWSHLTLGAGVRNHPHNIDKSVETEFSPAFISARISNAVYPFAYVNWEFRLAKWAYLGITMYQPLNIDPVIYAPIFGINLRLTHLARERNEWTGPHPTPVPVSHTE